MIYTLLFSYWEFKEAKFKTMLVFARWQFAQDEKILGGVILFIVCTLHIRNNIVMFITSLNIRRRAKASPAHPNQRGW